MLKDIFIKNKILLFIFLICVLLYIFISTLTYRGLFLDIPTMFFDFLDLENNNVKYIYFKIFRTRFFSNILLAIPYNLLHNFFPDIPIIKNGLFTFSYMFSTFAVLGINYYIAKRTNRYDIAIIALTFYALGYLPGSIWFVREFYIAVPFYFALMQYFLSEKILQRKDYFIVALLLIYQCESFEIMLFTGLLMFTTGILFYKKNDKKTKQYFIIGLFALLSSIYIIIKTVIGFLTKSSGINFDSALSEYVTSLDYVFNNMFTDSMIFTTAAIIIFLYTLIKKINLSSKNFRGLFLISLLLIYFLYRNQKFMPQDGSEQYYMFSAFMMILISIILYVLEYKKIQFDKVICYNNLLILTCWFGIFNCLWQFYGCYLSYDYAKTIQHRLKASTDTIVYFTEEDKKKTSYIFDKCFGTFQRSILLSDLGKVNTFLFPSEDSSGYGDICIPPPPSSTFYMKDFDSLFLMYSFFKVKGKYWDLSEIVPYIVYFQENSKLPQNKQTNK